MIFQNSNASLLAISDAKNVKVYKVSASPDSQQPLLTEKFCQSYAPISIAISNDGNFIALSGADKNLDFYSLQSGAELWCKPVNKRIGNILFTKDDKRIVVADRFGDVYEFMADESSSTPVQSAKEDPSVNAKSNHGKLLCGHVSLVTDMLLVDNDQFLITADRDEKIRVSKYPKTHLIHGFCFEHTQYVSTICCLQAYPDILVSGGGDGFVVMWQWKSMKVLQKLELKSLLRDKLSNDTCDISCIVEIGSLLAVIIESQPLLLFLKYDKSEKCLKMVGEAVELTGCPLSVSSFIDSNGTAQLWIQYYDKTESIECYAVSEDGKIAVQPVPENVQSSFSPVKADDEALIHLKREFRKERDSPLEVTETNKENCKKRKNN